MKEPDQNTQCQQSQFLWEHRQEETKEAVNKEGVPKELYKLKFEKQARINQLNNEEGRERVLKAERTPIYSYYLFHS